MIGDTSSRQTNRDYYFIFIEDENYPQRIGADPESTNPG